MGPSMRRPSPVMFSMREGKNGFENDGHFFDLSPRYISDSFGNDGTDIVVITRRHFGHT